MSFVRDLRVAFYPLIRTPGLAIAVVLTLSLGIGANAAIFTLVRSSLRLARGLSRTPRFALLCC